MNAEAEIIETTDVLVSIPSQKIEEILNLCLMIINTEVIYNESPLNMANEAISSNAKAAEKIESILEYVIDSRYKILKD